MREMLKCLTTTDGIKGIFVKWQRICFNIAKTEMDRVFLIEWGIAPIKKVNGVNIMAELTQKSGQNTATRAHIKNGSTFSKSNRNG